MAINKKLIHFKTKAAFDNEYKAGNILETSICWIKDSQQIFTHDWGLQGVTPELLEKLDLLEEEIKEIKNSLYEDPTNGYDYVDMGEAGIWATCNIGASTPTDYGLYFQWGDIQGYSQEQIGVDKQFNSDFTDYKFSDEAESYSVPNFIKYNQNEIYGKDGFTDELTILQPEDDAVVQNMGGNWRMPTVEDFQKLYDLCIHGPASFFNGVNCNGIIFQLKTDPSKQIFFPKAGSATNGACKRYRTDAYYWLPTIYSKNTRNAQVMYPNLNNAALSQELSQINKSIGCPIRGFMPSIPDSEKYLPKKEAEEIYATKDELNSINSDWDAKEGEKGYILNNPLIDVETGVLWLKDTVSTITDESGSGISYKSIKLKKEGMTSRDDIPEGNIKLKVGNIEKTLTYLATGNPCFVDAGDGNLAARVTTIKVSPAWTPTDNWYMKLEYRHDLYIIKSNDSVEIYTSGEIKKQIDPKYLPTVDWEAKKDDSGYIENKPFGEEIIQNDIIGLNEAELTATTVAGNGYQVTSKNNWGLLSGFKFSLNDTYKVILNGVVYDNLTILSQQGTWHLSNDYTGTASPLFEKADFEIFITNQGANITYVMVKESFNVGSIVISRKSKESIIKQLDSKYLPIVQESGDAEDKLMSQKAVTEYFATKDDLINTFEIVLDTSQGDMNALVETPEETLSKIYTALKTNPLNTIVYITIRNSFDLVQSVKADYFNILPISDEYVNEIGKSPQLMATLGNNTFLITIDARLKASVEVVSNDVVTIIDELSEKVREMEKLKNFIPLVLPNLQTLLATSDPLNESIYEELLKAIDSHRPIICQINNQYLKIVSYYKNSGNIYLIFIASDKAVNQVYIDTNRKFHIS